MSWLLPILFLVLAALFKAVADTLQHHYDTSVFKNKDVKWWNPTISWKYVKFLPYTKYRPDAWHLSNSLMIICFVLTAVFHNQYLSWWLELIMMGLIFNLAFILFYDEILR